MVRILKRDEKIVLIKVLYVLIIALINAFLIHDLTKINFVYQYILGVPDIFILVMLLVYLMLVDNQRIKNKRLGIV